MNRCQDKRPSATSLLLLVVLLAGCASKPYETGPAINASAFKQIVYTLAAPKMQGRDAGTEGIELARDYVLDTLVRVDLKPAFVIDGKPSYTQPFDIPVGVDADGVTILARIENVGAILPGVGSLADEVVVVGAHYDHVGFGDVGARDKERKGELHPGADDNASGTAGVMLLAQEFALRKRCPAMPRRTILFTCFAGEERGLLGSRFMTNHPDQWAFDGTKVVGMINLDMIGRLRNDELYLFGDESGRQWRQWTIAANRALEVDLKWDVRAPGGSDHTPFIAFGVPAIFFNTFIHPEYHTPSDTPDTVNNEGGARVLSLVAALLEHTATTRERVDYVPPKLPKPRPYLGVRMESHERGVLLAEVPEGPMKKAGALPGDVVLSIEGKPMKTEGDVRTWLNSKSSGDEVAVTVLRGEETIELKVRLDLRR